MKLSKYCLFLCATLIPLAHGAPLVDLGTAANFAVLAGSTITNTGDTVISGDIGVFPGTAITGFPPGVVGTFDTMYSGGAVAEQAQIDLTTAYNFAVSQTCTSDLTGQDLGTLAALSPGVYCFDTSAQLTGILTLDGGGDPNASFIFKMGETLTTASASSVVLMGGAQGANIFWQVGSSATLGTTTDFTGNILALTSITLTTGASIDCGSALAQNGAVTMDTNYINSCGVSGEIPEPGTVGLLGAGLILFGIRRLRRR